MGARAVGPITPPNNALAQRPIRETADAGTPEEVLEAAHDKMKASLALFYDLFTEEADAADVQEARAVPTGLDR